MISKLARIALALQDFYLAHNSDGSNIFVGTTSYGQLTNNTVEFKIATKTIQIQIEYSTSGLFARIPRAIYCKAPATRHKCMSSAVLHMKTHSCSYFLVCVTRTALSYHLKLPALKSLDKRDDDRHGIACSPSASENQLYFNYLFSVISPHTSHRVLIECRSELSAKLLHQIKIVREAKKKCSTEYISTEFNSIESAKFYLV